MQTSHTKHLALFLLIFCFCGMDLATAQNSRFSYQKFTNNQGDTLNYRQLNPDYNPSRKYPLIIFLHGSGERGKDNEAQLKWGVMNFATDQMMSTHQAIVIAPQCPEKQSWSNFSRTDKPREARLMDTPSKPMDLVIQLIKKMIRELPVDAGRIYITGLSMGGFGTFDAIERYPDLFAAAVPVCGGGDISLAASIVKMPIWIFHGSEDASVNPEYSLSMVEALTQAGGHPGYTQYPETGHFSWLAAYSDPMMIDWLFRQHK
jgi:predicted peptidase